MPQFSSVLLEGGQPTLNTSGSCDYPTQRGLLWPPVLAQQSKTCSLGHCPPLYKPNGAAAKLLCILVHSQVSQIVPNCSCFEAALHVLRHKMQEWIRVQGWNPKVLGWNSGSTAHQPWDLTQVAYPSTFFWENIIYHTGLWCGLPEIICTECLAQYIGSTRKKFYL